jgi:RNA polymerase sigma factor (sigma-70 family)
LLVLQQCAPQTDAEIFSEHFTQHARAAVAVARGVLGDFDAAEEAVQEAAYRAWRAWPRFDATRAFQPWFLRIVRNAAVDELTRRRRTAPLAAEPREGGPSTADVTVLRERTTEVGRALAVLPRGHRTALVLRCVHDLEYDTIATVLGTPSATVRIHVYRARQRLRGLYASSN